jgi:hypothetical protein
MDSSQAEDLVRFPPSRRSCEMGHCGLAYVVFVEWSLKLWIRGQIAGRYVARRIGEFGMPFLVFGVGDDDLGKNIERLGNNYFRPKVSRQKLPLFGDQSRVIDFIYAIYHSSNPLRTLSSTV